MKTHIEATYVGGQFKPDEVFPLPEDTRVQLTIEVLDDDDDSDDESDDDSDWSPEKARAAWEAIKERLKKRPIHGGGKRFTRDELYERL
jgi:hypothetical protein